MKANNCPVCGMDASATQITTEYLGISHHFCSQQCLENFTSRPLLYLGIKSQKQNGKSLLKRRTFMLDSSIPKSGEDSLKSVLTEMMGVREAQVSGAKVSVTYDLLEATAMQIEQTLEQAGTKLGAGWADQLKRGWVHYTEENALDNLAATDAPCCNKPPTKR